MPKCGKRVGIAQGGSGKVIRPEHPQGTLAVYTEEGMEVEVEIKDLREPQPLPASRPTAPLPGPENGGRGSAELPRLDPPRPAGGASRPTIPTRAMTEP
jgi:hypothetical protein